MKKNLKKGFTLIELLVVIAIIGILSGIVLASLNTARSKGADAAIKGNLGGLRPQAELVYDSNGCYADGTAAGSGCAATAFTAGACAATADTIFAETTFASAWAAAKTASGGTAGIAACASTANQTAWALAVPMKADTTKAWCVDSTGAAKEINNGTTAYNQATLNADVTGGFCGS